MRELRKINAFELALRTHFSFQPLFHCLVMCGPGRQIAKNGHTLLWILLCAFQQFVQQFEHQRRFTSTSFPQNEQLALRSVEDIDDRCAEKQIYWLGLCPVLLSG